MESVLLALMFVSIGGFWGEPKVTAVPASTVRVRLGEDATLHCPLLDTSSTNLPAAQNASSTLSWYRKAEGQRPHLLLTFRASDSSSMKYGSGVGPEKISASGDGSLLLRGSEHSDSAVYYCGISRGEELHRNQPEP